MRYWAAVILVGFIVGAAGHSSQDSLLQDAWDARVASRCGHADPGELAALARPAPPSSLNPQRASLILALLILTHAQLSAWDHTRRSALAR